MSKQSELAGIAHNIAHHAGSGLSALSPHLAQALRAAGAETTSVELLQDQPYPSNATPLESLRFALQTLRQTVLALLQKHGFEPDDVQSIVLHATPTPWDNTGYSLHTRAVVTSKLGRAFDSGWIQ